MASKFVLNKTATQAYVQKVSRQYVARAADEMEGAARRIAPVRKPNENGRSGGRLRASIGTKAGGTASVITYRIGSRVKYAEPAHQGAGPHKIYPRRKQFLSFKWNKAAQYGIPVTRRGKVQLKSVNHPGMRGKSYLTTPLVIVGHKYGFRVTFVHAIR